MRTNMESESSYLRRQEDSDFQKENNKNGKDKKRKSA